MIEVKSFTYPPPEHEAEKASNSYLMSMIAIMVGMPLPIVNLIATLGFYMAHRKSEYYVRWHCTQALLAQFLLLCMNAAAFYWVISVVFGSSTVTNAFLSYLITVFLFNLIEFAMTIFTAVKTGKGVHVEWWFLGPLTNFICKP